MAQAEQNQATPQRTFHFIRPIKRIHAETDLVTFENSEAFKRFVGFILYINEMIKGKKISSASQQPEIIIKILDIFRRMHLWLDEIPPEKQQQRFGNKSFRTWYDRLVENAESLMLELIPPHLAGAEIELAEYFKESFGNRVRIDYGTGHEAAFAAWLACLTVLELVTPEYHKDLILKVFTEYLTFIRRVQQYYMLEPAGSHGVWGLDDYQFLPFLWGSSQIMDFAEFPPKSVLDDNIVNRNADEFFYFAGIKYIKETKKGPFSEHSPKLFDITNHTWHKANQGLIRMYRAEVLKKFPVIQHFVFGSILPYEPVHA
jgi:serine/threonine-protein phosphatase 2A activator